MLITIAGIVLFVLVLVFTGLGGFLLGVIAVLTKMAILAITLLIVTVFRLVTWPVALIASAFAKKS